MMTVLTGESEIRNDYNAGEINFRIQKNSDLTKKRLVLYLQWRDPKTMTFISSIIGIFFTPSQNRKQKNGILHLNFSIRKDRQYKEM